MGGSLALVAIDVPRRGPPPMEQIYYTQCPIGYGLGASNGFQIKRLGAGYPASGDFRFLGMRAFLPGSRVLAPTVLRYRLDGEVAEIAALTPRAQEYQTERGLWGRPGGHFAHGLRLDKAELAAFANWPAGLFDRPGWRRSDPEPSRGRQPEPADLDFSTPPTFAAVAPMAAGQDPSRLARLLTAAAASAREGRTLFLIDEPAKLAGLIALLTFAFPAALRPALTFSTYHDRPEELPGFRIQGTTHAARPNRPALAASGVVVDLVAGSFEPPVEPSRWARTLAGWFVEGGHAADRAWTATDARAGSARMPSAPESPWEDAWLDHLFGFQEGLDSAASPPIDAEGWMQLAGLASWSHRSGLAEDWTQARGPSWWTSAAGTARDAQVQLALRGALLAHLKMTEAWRGGKGAAWGAAFAGAFATAGDGERDQGLRMIMESAPAKEKPALLAAAIRGLPEGLGAATLARLKAGGGIDPSVLIPQEARAAAACALETGNLAPLREALRRALERPAVIPATLDALAAEVAGRDRAMETLAPALADAFDSAEALDRDEPTAWALLREDGAAWLGPHLRRLMGPSRGTDSWRRLRDRTPQPLRPALARVFLAVADEPQQADEPFRWGVEELLLTLPEPDRPRDPSWPDRFLERTPSGLDLLRKLFGKDALTGELRQWLSAARKRGELSEAQTGRIGQVSAYAKALASGDARSLINSELPQVPPSDRGAIFGQILARVGGASFQRLDLCLDSCRQAWPGAFEAGSPGLDGLARPLAQALASYRGETDTWLAHLRRTLDRLGVETADGRGFEPDSLAAEIVAATSRLPESDPWRFRRSLLHREDTWRLLAIDARRDGLEGPEPGRAPAALERWDGKLDKPGPGMVARFFELMLNACDGPALAACAPSRAADLRSLAPLPWWPAARTPGATGDLRDGFARIAPMAPLEVEALPMTRLWMRAPSRVAPTPIVRMDDGPDLIPLEGGDPEPAPGRARHVDPDVSHLSEFARARWRCLDALTVLSRPGLDEAMRWAILQSWIDSRLPIDRIGSEDRWRFLAHLISLAGTLDGHQVEKLGRWLVRAGIDDSERLASWADDLGGEVPDALRIERMALAGDLRSVVKTALLEFHAGRRKA